MLNKIGWGADASINYQASFGQWEVTLKSSDDYFEGRTWAILQITMSQTTNKETFYLADENLGIGCSKGSSLGST